MAYALYVRMLERKIERLKDPFRLSEREKAGIHQLLSPEDEVEIERRRIEILEYNKFMALPMDLPHKEFHRNRLYWSLDLFYQEYPNQQGRIKRAQKRIAEKKARGIKNPTAYSELNRKVNFHTQYSLSLVDSVRRAYEALSSDDALFWEHRGEWTSDNLPRVVESWENVLWPNHPNASRQAYIEVLEEKLQRARES